MDTLKAKYSPQIQVGRKVWGGSKIPMARTLIYGHENRPNQRIWGYAMFQQSLLPTMMPHGFTACPWATFKWIISSLDFALLVGMSFETQVWPMTFRQSMIKGASLQYLSKCLTSRPWNLLWASHMHQLLVGYIHLHPSMCGWLHTLLQVVLCVLCTTVLVRNNFR